MSAHRFFIKARAFSLFCLATAVASSAQITFTTLADFDSGGYGGHPMFMSLIQGTDGNFYGTTGFGGENGLGTIFKATPGGKLDRLYSFCNGTRCPDGRSPFAGLTVARDGNFYGTTSRGGSPGDGTIFKFTSQGKLTTLHTFCLLRKQCFDGAEPSAALIQGTDGIFYGTTFTGGVGPNGAIFHGGTLFKVTAGGKLTTLYTFCLYKTCVGGGLPFGTLVQATDGNFYGTTSQNNEFIGDGIGGTVFKVSAQGKKLTTLYTFCSQPNCADGSLPYAGLIQATDGDLYGTTVQGGANNQGTVFRISAGGDLTTVYSFCSQTNCSDGAMPYAGLVQATDGNFYGATFRGGSNSRGTIFEITPTGTLTTLYSFCSKPDCADGSSPEGGLLPATDGNFYGTTTFGGPRDAGTYFSLSTGLTPFVKIQPATAAAGAAVIILGNNLTGTTDVTFNGTAAAFTVVSDTEITATVPTGATTGTVQVTTTSSLLNSNVVFRVKS